LVVITVTTPAPQASAATTAVVRTTEVGVAEAVDRTAERAGVEPTVGLDDLVVNVHQAQVPYRAHRGARHLKLVLTAD
jgi:hypothetical protein